MKKTKKRTMYLLLSLILFVSVGYAILQSNLTITGTTSIQDSKWDIHWNNVVITEGSVSTSNADKATIDNTKTTVNYNIVLDKPGDFYEFTVDAVNGGVIDAMIDTIDSKLNGATITTLPAYLNYTVTYAEDFPLAVNQELKANTTETYKVRVEYSTDINLNQIPATNQTLSLQFMVTYRQATNDAIPVVSTRSFVEDDWDTIIAAVSRGITDNYNVGDTKTIDMGTFGTHIVRIANKSTPSECSDEEFSQTACGFVIEFADIITKHGMNSTITNEGGWSASEMRTYVNNDVYNALPSELKNTIINTKVVSGLGYNLDAPTTISTDKLYLLATHEVWEDADGNAYSGINDRDKSYAYTRQLDYYSSLGVTTSNYSMEKKLYAGSYCWWWVRSADILYTESFYIVGAGGPGTTHADTSLGVSPAFRIG